MAMIFMAIWGSVHEPRPHLPTSDLYTHLTVARHLARGEGFNTDVTYPLSFAFPFARELPQPLIHRQPGFAILLTGTYFFGEGIPDRVLNDVRTMQMILLGLIVALGAGWLFQARQSASALIWLILLFFNPLLVFAVDWGMVELVCAFLLLVLWLRIRAGNHDRPGPLDGLLAGMTVMLRMDLVWVPFLWWIVLGFRRRKNGLPYRHLGLVLLAWLLVTTPWAIRNVRLTGNPVFSLQSHAEHVKDTSSWPAYSVYRQLEPQTLTRTLATDPVPVLRKTARGLKFYFRHLPRLVPLPILLVLAAGSLVHAWRRLQLRKRSVVTHSGPEFGPIALATATTVLLAAQYSVFDHSLRHLLVVLPVLFLEFSFWLGGVISRFSISANRRFNLPEMPWASGVAAAGLALALVLIFPCRLPGWQTAAAEAVAQVRPTIEAIERNRNSSADILFVTRSAIPWFIDRPVIWNPEDEVTRDRIRVLLGKGRITPQEKP